MAFIRIAKVTLRSSNRRQRVRTECLSSIKYVQCDVTRWDDQLRLFREAADFSPSGKIHYVIANAGVAKVDQVFSYEGILPNCPSRRLTSSPNSQKMLLINQIPASLMSI